MKIVSTGELVGCFSALLGMQELKLMASAELTPLGERLIFTAALLTLGCAVIAYLGRFAKRHLRVWGTLLVGTGAIAGLLYSFGGAARVPKANDFDIGFQLSLLGGLHVVHLFFLTSLVVVFAFMREENQKEVA